MPKTAPTLSRATLALALAALPALAGDGTLNFSLGPAYVGGLKDVTDFYANRYATDSTTLIPVGLVFTPYYELNNGLRIGFDLGPVAVVMGDVHFTDVPVGASVGFTFTPSSEVSPYIRAGLRNHFASGTDVDSSTPGAFGALGVDFSRNRRVHWGFEMAVDTSSVSFTSSGTVYDPITGTGQTRTTTHKIKPDKFMAGIHVTF